MGLDPRKWTWPKRGYAVLVRVRRPDHPPVAYPGIVVHSALTWTRTRSTDGWMLAINQQNTVKRIATAIEVAPGRWEPYVAPLEDVARPGCERLQNQFWQAAIERGLPFIRAAIYCRDVPAAELFSRGGPVAPHRPRSGPARSPFARRLPPGVCW